MSRPRRGAPSGPALLPFLLDDVEYPGVGQELIELVAAEEHHLLVQRIVDEACVGPLRRFVIEDEPLPGIAPGRVGPSAGIAARRLDVAAAKEEEAFAVAVVAHRTPQQGAAEFFFR